MIRVLNEKLRIGVAFFILPALWLVLLVPGRPAAAAESEEDCAWVCAPALTAFPSVVLQNMFRQPRVQSLTTGEIGRMNTSANFSTIFNLQALTSIPRIELVGRVVIIHYADGDSNPFTGYSARELGVSSVDANAPFLEYGFAVDLVKKRETSNWFQLQLNILGGFGPSARPGDTRTYKHVFAPDLLATVHLFNWLPEDNWFRNVTFYALFNYQTGLARAGDVVPRGQQVYLDSADPFGLWIGFGIPIAPLWPS